MLSGPGKRNTQPYETLNGLLYVGKWIRIFLVLAFNLQKSMHGLWLGWIVPTSNISFMWALTSSTIGGGILQNLSLKGLSSATQISCFTRLVHPNSPDSSEKTLWYLVSRAWADVQFAPGYPSSPNKSSCWRSVSFLCSNIWVHQTPIISFSFSNVPGITSMGSTLFTATTQVILMPLLIVIGAAVRVSQ